MCIGIFHTSQTPELLGTDLRNAGVGLIALSSFGVHGNP